MTFGCIRDAVHVEEQQIEPGNPDTEAGNVFRKSDTKAENIYIEDIPP